VALQSIQSVRNAPKDSVSSPRRLRIAYVTMRDANDRRSWSGTLYNMAQALQRHCGDVLHVNPLEPRSLKVKKLISRFARRLTARNYLYTNTTSVAKETSRMAEERLSRLEYDVIFAPVGSGLTAQLQTSAPIVYLSDTTVRLMFGYNWEFSRLFPSNARMADELERQAVEKASQLVYPSSWAAASARDDYNADPSKINVVPFGANLDSAPTREVALRVSDGDRCQLLFVGVDWKYKGGEIAFEALLELERSGVAADLTIVGCTPPPSVRHPHLRVFPFLNKNNESERAQLNRLYSEADFFILPTRAECFGIAMCEASAFGIPVLSTKTGGVPGVVREGVNGFLFSLDARGDRYAARIRELCSNPTNYQKLRHSSREEFEARLNWDAWGAQMNAILQTAVNASRDPQPSEREHSVRR
jgi:glycosyltransferase involved in cell wall biosynthesis